MRVALPLYSISRLKAPYFERMYLIPERHSTEEKERKLCYLEGRKEKEMSK